MTVKPALSEMVEPLRADPGRSAVLFDIDGTLAPIVRHASDAHIPEDTRRALIAVAKRYGIVACVSGRSAVVARQMVGIGSIAYLGNHGLESLSPGAAEVVLDRRVLTYARRVHDFAASADSAEVQRLRVRLEDKGPIVAFHWRGAPNEEAAQAAVEQIEHDAQAAGLGTHRGRKVLEVRPPVPIDKGRGIALLLRKRHPANGLYVGDDLTDLDAFRGLRESVTGSAVCVAVGSEEAPAELLREADLVVDGPAGVRELLGELLR
ncbi:MAG TPA: trehalose-phosphatase [Solirubrobacteraceae bacterium]|nr:trehalose-phosphatase [Solirubrobacteraceae bacterium]